MPNFIPGLELSRLFFEEAVRPVLDADFPALRYAAARLGTGSEVLGFDDEVSTDHCWGPRLDLFLTEEDYETARAEIDDALRHKLPHELRGYPTSFSEPDPNDHGTFHLDARGSGPVNHGVSLTTPRRFFLYYLNFELDDEIEPADWLTFPGQRLGTLRSGRIFHDELSLEAARRRFDYYPQDVWLYLLAAGWTRVGQEEHLMGRAGSVGDELGSALIGARLVRDLMRLCFLFERQFAPYPKWFGTAFQKLSCARELTPHLDAALAARDWRERGEHLAAAYEFVAALHNSSGLTDPLAARARDFFGRPFKVIALNGFADALAARISDPRLRRLTGRHTVGSIDQFSDSTDLLEEVRLRPALRRLYE
jgi:hypothetical protein